MVPHVTDAIQEWVERVAKIPVARDGRKPEICVIEVRGRYFNRFCYVKIDLPNNCYLHGC